MANWQTTGPLSRFVRADNPGPMTLTGTNSYVLSGPGQHAVVVVDPGPLIESHVSALAATGRVELILITHRHIDHTEASVRLHELSGAPVRAFSEEFCHAGATLKDGEVVSAAGQQITVLATPGHTSDSLCFFIRDDGTHGSVLTGDTILGHGTTMLDYPDGTLVDYLASLKKLKLLADGAKGPVTVLPGHGEVLPDLGGVVQFYQEHRSERLAQVRAAVEYLQQKNGTEPDAIDVTAVVYADIPANVRGAALHSVRAQLEYLRT